MARGKRLSLLAAAFALLAFGAREGYACSCARTPTVLDAYEEADVVVVARAVSLVTAPKKEQPKPPEASAEKSGEQAEKKAAEQPEGSAEDERPGYGGVISTSMIVERVYKGGLKPGDEMVFGQGGGGNCVWTFEQDDVGDSYLFYLTRFKDTALWYAGTCGRSRPVGGAHDDLLYLDKLDKARGRTRISGTLGFGDARVSQPGVAGLKVRVVGAGKNYVVKTDEHGVYEIYDAPAGRYTVEPEVPPGWKVGTYWLRHSPSAADSDGGGPAKGPPKIPIVVEAKRHAGLDVVFEIDNAVAGRVFDTAGRPMDGVCLELLPARGEVPENYYNSDCTEGGGRFRFDEILPGDYVLVVNRGGHITNSTPFATFFYPNAARREEAAVLHVGLGDRVENLQVYVPKMEETVTVEGVFTYSDGKPVADEWVEFEVENAEESDPRNARARTDAKGRFSVRLLKGRKGVLYGEMYTYVGEFENCPKLDSAVRQTGGTNAKLRTPAVEIQGVGNLYNVELRYPFPGCKRAEQE
ncbi:MAG TPA: hypothetical protein VF570_17320 [Pyrinomonadaceae bacterium]|jgi:hypothetical protein